MRITFLLVKRYLQVAYYKSFLTKWRYFKLAVEVLLFAFLFENKLYHPILLTFLLGMADWRFRLQIKKLIVTDEEKRDFFVSNVCLHAHQISSTKTFIKYRIDDHNHPQLKKNQPVPPNFKVWRFPKDLL